MAFHHTLISPSHLHHPNPLRTTNRSANSKSYTIRSSYTMSEISKNIKVCDHPLIKHKVTLLRSRNIAPNQFRTLMREISYVAFPFLSKKRRFLFKFIFLKFLMCSCWMDSIFMHISMCCVDCAKICLKVFFCIDSVFSKRCECSLTHSLTHLFISHSSFCGPCPPITISIECFFQPEDYGPIYIYLYLGDFTNKYTLTKQTNTHAGSSWDTRRPRTSRSRPKKWRHRWR